MGFATIAGIVGEANVRAADASDAVDGVQPRLCAYPGSVGEVSKLMQLVSETDWKVAPVGSRTKQGWGNPPKLLDLILCTRRLDRLIEHSAGDLVVSAAAGMTLTSLQARLATAGQMLALDLPSNDATLGGVVATDISGPRRFRYGTPRDLLVGITVVLPDGTVAKSGGKVVKNVAGYDLGKLFTGSFGTLGVIVQATFRLHPRPAALRLVEVIVADAAEAGIVLGGVLQSSVTPTAINLAGGTGLPIRIGLLVEGSEPGTRDQARTAAELLRGREQPLVMDGPAVAERWRELAELSGKDTDVMLKVTHLRAELPAVLCWVDEEVGRAEIRSWWRGQIGNGVLFIGLYGGDPSKYGTLIRDLRSFLSEGSVVVVEAPLALKRRVDAWGPVGDSLSLMRRVKAQFDPAAVLNPGRFVGGI